MRFHLHSGLDQFVEAFHFARFYHFYICYTSPMDLRHTKKSYASSLLIIVVVLLSPSIGLMTLPIPDNEPDSMSITTLTDAHTSKRVQGDTLHISTALLSTRVVAAHTYVLVPVTPVPFTERLSRVVRLIHNSRAPPLV